MLNDSCFSSSPCYVEVPVELNASWTERARKHSLCDGGVHPQLNEPQTKQQSQMLSFGTRQLAALIHLFYSALLQATYSSLAICLFCVGCSSIFHSSL